MVLNGNGRTGAAASAASRVRLGSHRGGHRRNASSTDFARSLVMAKLSSPARPGLPAKDLRVKQVGPLDGIRVRDLGRAHVVFILGAQGRACPRCASVRLWRSAAAVAAGHLYRQPTTGGIRKPSDSVTSAMLAAPRPASRPGPATCSIHRPAAGPWCGPRLRPTRRMGSGAPSTEEPERILKSISGLKLDGVHVRLFGGARWKSWRSPTCWTRKNGSTESGLKNRLVRAVLRARSPRCSGRGSTPHARVGERGEANDTSNATASRAAPTPRTGCTSPSLLERAVLQPRGLRERDHRGRGQGHGEEVPVVVDERVQEIREGRSHEARGGSASSLRRAQQRSDGDSRGGHERAEQPECEKPSPFCGCCRARCAAVQDVPRIGAVALPRDLERAGRPCPPARFPRGIRRPPHHQHQRLLASSEPSL